MGQIKVYDKQSSLGRKKESGAKGRSTSVLVWKGPGPVQRGERDTHMVMAIV